MASLIGNDTAINIALNLTSSVLTTMMSQSLEHLIGNLSSELDDIARDKNESTDMISNVVPSKTTVYHNASTVTPTHSTPLSSTIPRLRFDGRDGLVWRLASTGQMGGALIMLGLAAVVTLIIILGLMSCVRRRKHVMYQKLATSETANYDYIYRPLQGGRLDEEYENTFVGVSIPLLQDNTKV